ncbi:DMT family transporter [Paenibacillus paeoniae]|uniref:DMT family transporter n=1 Tax=Paenibacillus paeoniae TaxID=2292705 RepID=A0A371PI53_9BACL|nr:DMT family transporter [Paenibacillus paeoniae]REK75060.1 DMT family transporter [Paenibacillus paeoniae]
METVLGLLFSLLWSSASIAIKFGLQSTTPLALASIRFILAGTLMLIFVYGISRKYPWPSRKEFGPLIVLGLLNTTIYIGATLWALNYVSAGLFNLFVAVNPFLVAFLSYIWLKRSISIKEWIGMGVAAFGLLIAVWPALASAEGKLIGFLLIGIGMTSMALGSVYFKKANLQLPGIVINTWQLSIGGAVSVPLAYFIEKDQFFLKLDLNLAGSLLWLVLVISIGSMLLWFYMLKRDAVKANNWLFMTPIFGYMLAAVLLHEKITAFDIVATMFVVTGLFMSGNIQLNPMKLFQTGIRQGSLSRK